MGRIKLTDFLGAFYGIWRAEWVEVEGCIVQIGGGQNVRSRRKDVRKYLEEGLSGREVEATINHVHVCLIGMDDRGAHPSDYRTVAEIIVAVWEKRLREQFPDRRFVVEISGEGDETIVTAYQEESGEVRPAAPIPTDSGQ